MKIEINALDTLFFRDGKPFERGNESWANGVFPPMPSVLYGALRTAFLSQQTELSLEEGIKQTEKIKIRSIVLKQIDSSPELCFPMPLDLVGITEGNRTKTMLLNLHTEPVVSSRNTDLQGFLYSTSPGKKEDLAGKAFLRAIHFEEYLQGESHTFTPIYMADSMVVEPKVGIGRNKHSRTVEEGLLYRVGMVRPENKKNRWNFVVDFEYPDATLLPQGFFKLGGEGKSISYHSTTDEMAFPVPTMNTPYLKIYLATPAIFKQGWRPTTFLDSAGGTLTISYEIIACAIGKPQMVGGFDMYKRMPKPMYKAVPAGAVYYLKTNSKEDAQHLAQALHGRSISEYRANEGFGICYVAAVTQGINK